MERRSFALGSGTRIDLGLRGDTYWLREAWAKVFVPDIAEAARDLIMIADRHLRRAHQLLTASGTARPQWDPLCFSRAAIEPHPQDSMGEPADVIIDAARDCLEALLDTGKDSGVAYLMTWAESEMPLLRRLAVHGWAYRTDMGASAKLAWLRERGWLFDRQLRHEVFRPIAVTVADAAREIANALVVTLLGSGEGGGDPARGYGLAAEGAGGEGEGEHDLQFVQDLVEGHPGAGACGSSLIMVQKAWARAARVTWRCQPVKTGVLAPSSASWVRASRGDGSSG